MRTARHAAARLHRVGDLATCALCPNRTHADWPVCTKCHAGLPTPARKEFDGARSVNGRAAAIIRFRRSGCDLGRARIVL